MKPIRETLGWFRFATPKRSRRRPGSGTACPAIESRMSENLEDRMLLSATSCDYADPPDPTLDPAELSAGGPFFSIGMVGTTPTAFLIGTEGDDVMAVANTATATIFQSGTFTQPCRTAHSRTSS